MEFLSEKGFANWWNWSEENPLWFSNVMDQSEGWGSSCEILGGGFGDQFFGFWFLDLVCCSWCEGFQNLSSSIEEFRATPIVTVTWFSQQSIGVQRFWGQCQMLFIPPIKSTYVIHLCWLSINWERERETHTQTSKVHRWLEFLGWLRVGSGLEGCHSLNNQWAMKIWITFGLCRWEKSMWFFY